MTEKCKKKKVVCKTKTGKVTFLVRKSPAVIKNKIESIEFLKKKNFDLAIRSKSRQQTIISMRKTLKRLREKIISLEKRE